MLQLFKQASVTGLLLLVSFAAQAWNGRAVPMSFDTRTGQWNILLHLDSAGYWSDFVGQAARGERANIVAHRALEAGTRGTNVASDASFADIPWYRTPSEDVVHFVTVPYVPARDLYQATSAAGSDFVWVPASSILSATGDVRPHRTKQNTISRGALGMLKRYLPDAISQLSAGTSAAAAAPSAGTSAAAAAAAPAGSSAASSGTATSGTTNWLTIPGALLFYESTQPYYEFTNFASGYPFTLAGASWPTSEHYFQAQKFVSHPRLYAQIRAASTPREAFDIAQANAASVRSDWKSISLDVMLDALRQKFENPTLKSLLLSTYPRTLVENAGSKDNFWGAGATGTGKNHLGRMLMHVREEKYTGIQKPYPK